MSMLGTQVKQGGEQGIRKLLAGIASAMAETLRSSLGRSVSVRPGDTSLCAVDVMLGSIKSETAVVRGALDKDYAGKYLWLTFEARDAATMSGLATKAAEQVIDERRKKGVLEGEDLQAFTEVANVLCSGLDGALRGLVGQGIGLRLQDHGLLKPGLDAQGILGTQPLVVSSCKLKIADYPETTCLVIVDPQSAEQWNGKPLELTDAAEAKSHDAAGDHAALSQTQAERKQALQAAEELEAIPPAPIRGRLAAFVVDTDAFLAVRKSCRRVGLDLDRRSRNEIPNPAAHRDQIVVIEVHAGEDKRIDWCKRLKAFHDGIKVVLLLHHPTRQRVLQGFMAKADALLGIPVEESLLSAKLGPILEAMLKAKEQGAQPPADPAKPAG